MPVESDSGSGALTAVLYVAPPESSLYMLLAIRRRVLKRLGE